MIDMTTYTDAQIKAMTGDALHCLSHHKWPNGVTPDWVEDVTRDLGPVVGSIARHHEAKQRVVREAARRFCNTP